ncbi:MULTISPECIES: response regulator [Achromobacter]|jgi:two-component system response regulator TctD|uniref:Response regulator n=1 Tax=Achromobacter aegrifaciens TaxID=1287736 RepID=A0AAD2J1K6_ACHAE|nr:MULTISPECIES: response regulator [Achromobacter]PTN48964.1 DNA-binding response regulator [Achromobacter xylosoxidans]MBD9385415.1 response regulator [Achromobacter sp. ACM02]MBD9423179.1 response regulator [Achromobacter sp. ACM04]MBD9433695.1 response regulator [Achromobacter sp. ACM03]MDQ1759089.1 response regulator [Achromobacter aegrifaciens]
MRILLIEDEAELARWLSRSLARHAGFVVEWADDGLVAERRLAMEEFDAVILDLGLPGMDGHALLAKIRARDDRTPVLVLTARDSLAEKIGTLHQGADDFLPKPFVVEELEARLIALIRRSRGREHPRLTLGNLAFETSAQKFTVNGQPLQLSPREHSVLRVLIQKSGEPINKQQILDRILTDDADINLEAIEVLVHRLRKKLADTGVQIVTMRGMGYCLENLVDN